MEWIAPSGQRTLRNCLETCSFAEAYDRIYPVPKEEREKQDKARQDSEQGLREETNRDSSAEQQLATELSLTASRDNEEVRQVETGPSREVQGTDAAKNDESKEEDRKAEDATHRGGGLPSTSESSAPGEVLPHRNLYFYLHRPRTATRKTVLIPVSPTALFNTVLRNRTIVEFPTVYVLESSPKELSTKKDSEFLLEEQYLQARKEAGEEEEEEAVEDSSSEDTLDGDEEQENDGHSNGTAAEAAAAANLDNIDEKKVLEVLKQDLLQTDTGTNASTTATSTG